jgi:hypothetical protein
VSLPHGQLRGEHVLGGALVGVADLIRDLSHERGVGGLEDGVAGALTNEAGEDGAGATEGVDLGLR